MRRLLLLACSRRKRLDAGVLPAVERYDGPAYRVLRRYMQTHPQTAPEVYILSAQFGLICGDTRIPWYDQRMTPERVWELRESVTAELQDLELASYHHVFLHAGAIYRGMLTSTSLGMLPRTRLTVAAGNPGCQLTRLKSWLYQHPSLQAELRAAAVEHPMRVRFKLRGSEYATTQAEVIAIARTAMQNNVTEAASITAWYVLVDEYRLAPKWLVSQLTGLSVSEFHSEAARRVLGQLGLMVRQV